MMTGFPKFDFDKFERKILQKPKALSALVNLEDKVVDFTKYYNALNEDERMKVEERAAIMEYDGGLTRKQAEIQALQNVIYMKDYKNSKP